jgi:hypothetical protein
VGAGSPNARGGRQQSHHKFPPQQQRKVVCVMGQSEPPTQNAKGWMVGGQEILFYWVPVP